MMVVAEPGTLWTVPAVDGLCVVVSPIQWMGTEATHEVLPAYEPDAESTHGGADFLVRVEDSNIGYDLLLAFWNLRSIRASSLHTELGRITSTEVMADLWESWLATPTLRSRQRFATDLPVTSTIARWRESELRKWKAAFDRP